MGFGGVSIGSLLLILVIVVLLFGTKKLRSVGTDLGAAIKSFREGMQDSDANTSSSEKTTDDNKK